MDGIGGRNQQRGTSRQAIAPEQPLLPCCRVDRDLELGNEDVAGGRIDEFERPARAGPRYFGQETGHGRVSAARNVFCCL